MKYYFKIGKNFFKRSIGVLIWLSIIASHILWQPKSGIDKFYYYLAVFGGMVIIIHIINNYKLIILVLRKKPLLEANEICVFDCVNNIKYYWTDINTIDANEDDRTLYIDVNDPAKYLSFFGNFYNRYYHYSKRKKRFNIDLDCVKAHMKSLITTLDNYSIQAQEVEESKR
jgi:hypothetical protein